MHSQLDDEVTQEIKADCQKLLNLLNDPHPGLFTWCEFLGTTAWRLRNNLNKKIGE